MTRRTHPPFTHQLITSALKQDSISLTETPAHNVGNFQADLSHEPEVAAVVTDNNVVTPVKERTVITDVPALQDEKVVLPDSAFYLYPFEVADTSTEPEQSVTATPPDWESGLLPVMRTTGGNASADFTPTVVILMLALCLSFNTIKRIWSTLVKRLWTTKLREGYEHFTGTERRSVALMLCVTIFFMAIIWNGAMSIVHPSDFQVNITNTLRLTSIVSVYFVFQYVTYNIIGYTFITSEGRQLWLEGFTASMALLGVVLLLPGIVVLFYPEILHFAVIFSAFIYILVRFLFICKGFRIFYTNLGSLVYFILYLCTLEIIPLVILYFIALHV